MSNIIYFAIAAVVLLAIAIAIVTLKGSDSSAATTQLSREARKKDKARRKREATLPPPPSGRALERAIVADTLSPNEAEKLALAASVASASGSLPVGASNKSLQPTQPVLRPPMDADQLGTTRRSFLNRAIIVAFIAGLANFGAALLAFLWPSLSGGFGSKVTLGKLSDIVAQITEKKTPFYSAEARTYVALYPKSAMVKAKKAYSGATLPGMDQGVIALYQKCVHLGCKVPFCSSSQWFECPCHGSQYNSVGEKKGGPAPRGLDQFAITVSGGLIVVDTSKRLDGVPIGVNTTGQEADGPHCVGGK